MQKIRLYSSTKLFAVAVALSVALSVFIFCMSNEPATVSAERSGGIAGVIAPLFVWNFDELDSAEREEILSDIDHVVRKIAHFCLYATLGALFTSASFWYSRTWIAHLLLPTLFGTLYAASDEIHQMFVPGRGPLFSDVVLDSCGVLAGVLFVIAIARVVLEKCPINNIRGL